MQVHLLLEQQRPHFYCEVEELTFKGTETISIFTYYLIVLFFNRVFQAIDKIQKLFPFEKFGFVLFNVLLHFWSFTEICEFFGVKLCELYGFFRLLSPLIFFWAGVRFFFEAKQEVNFVDFAMINLLFRLFCFLRYVYDFLLFKRLPLFNFMLKLSLVVGFLYLLLLLWFLLVWVFWFMFFCCQFLLLGFVF